MPLSHQAKVALAVAVPVIGIGAPATFYYLKKKQRIITISELSPKDLIVCQTWANFTVTITDGLGNPVPDETFTITTCLDSQCYKDPNVWQVGPDGTAQMAVCFGATQHLDQDVALNLKVIVECKGAKAERRKGAKAQRRKEQNFAAVITYLIQGGSAALHSPCIFLNR